MGNCSNTGCMKNDNEKDAGVSDNNHLGKDNDNKT